MHEEQDKVRYYYPVIFGEGVAITLGGDKNLNSGIDKVFWEILLEVPSGSKTLLTHPSPEQAFIESCTLARKNIFTIRWTSGG